MDKCLDGGSCGEGGFCEKCPNVPKERSGDSDLLRGSMLHDGLSQIVRWREVGKENPEKNGRYIVLANDIVSEWQDYVEWCDGFWCDENGWYAPIVTHWMPGLQRPTP